MPPPAMGIGRSDYSSKMSQVADGIILRRIDMVPEKLRTQW